ncbi:MAG TPA: hypothetical protein PKM58_11160 [Pyrinomonadaceae bacterium]|nr:hypothetical protein [Pyrinomonadaceae bacterium]HNU06327.1 hypothetical protein [Pyrinomonadaceae bacterium]
MTEEKKQHEDSSAREKLEAVGQMIVGEIEKIGGILTADPVTQAEGDYNLGAGSLHLQDAEAVSDGEESEPGA